MGMFSSAFCAELLLRFICFHNHWQLLQPLWFYTLLIAKKADFFSFWHLCTFPTGPSFGFLLTRTLANVISISGDPCPPKCIYLFLLNLNWISVQWFSRAMKLSQHWVSNWNYTLVKMLLISHYSLEQAFLFLCMMRLIFIERKQKLCPDGEVYKQARRIDMKPEWNACFFLLCLAIAWSNH